MHIPDSLLPPMITVIVAVFNGAKNLQRCIDSVAEQTYPYRELIVMDGGSVDATIEILKKSNREIAYWRSEPDRGISHAWNKALDYAQGQWMCFLGADDYFWRPDVLERIAPCLEGLYPPTRVAYGRVAVVTQQGDVLETVGRPWSELRSSLLQAMNISHQGVFHHRSLFEYRGRFDESFDIVGDYELLLREFKEVGPVFLPGVVVSGMQYGGLSTTLSFAGKALGEFRRARRKNGVPHNTTGWAWAYAKSRVKQGLYFLLGEKWSRACVDVYRVLSGRKPRGMRF